MSDFWKDKHVLCTGGYGFVGNYLCARLEELGAKIDSPKSSVFDLRKYSDVMDMFIYYDKPEIVFNLAANVGGIGYNQKHPYSLYFDNTAINLNMIHAAIEFNIKKFVQLGTVCAYPKFTTVPFDEKTLWDGYPEETNAPYGLAKRNSLVQLQAARQEFNFNGVYLLPTNLYGPHDHFDPERSHVIPALIKKFVEAVQINQEVVEIWGSGNASRDFLYIDDAVEGILLAAEKWDSPEPINLGSGNEVRIDSLVHILMEVTGYKGRINYNSSRPDGQPRRCLRTWRAKDLGWKPKVELREGLKRTVEWYQKSLL